MRIGVIGAGSWGTALAVLLANKGIETALWARKKDFVERLGRERENRAYLPGFQLPDSLTVTSELRKATLDRDVILFVIPSHGFRKVAEDTAAVLGRHPDALPAGIVSASKGIENGTLLTMTEVLEETLPQELSGKVASLSGPSFAREVALAVPTAVTLAAKNMHLARKLQDIFATETFRVYTSLDLAGVQIGGALKNVVAIAAGISDGLGFGTNTRAALITRGLAEMARLGIKLGANPLTFSGLAGLGDLVLTCTGELSRNRRVGLELGKGRRLEAILNEMTMVAEGVKTCRSAHFLAAKTGVEMPITTEVFRVLYEGCAPMKAVRNLLTRPLCQELRDFSP